MVKDDGKVEKVHNAISMMETILMIKRMGLVYLYGLLEIHIKENIETMREMGMVK